MLTLLTLHMCGHVSPRDGTRDNPLHVARVTPLRLVNKPSFKVEKVIARQAPTEAFKTSDDERSGIHRQVSRE